MFLNNKNTNIVANTYSTKKLNKIKTVFTTEVLKCKYLKKREYILVILIIKWKKTVVSIYMNK